MERLTEQTAADLARNRFAVEIAESTPEYNGPACENCHKLSSKLTLVPEFEYMGCDDCMEEALRQIAREHA